MRPFRKEKLARAIQHIVGEAIVHRLNDPRMNSLTTVTRVEMTGDLLIARVFVSVQGDEGVERRTLTAIQHAAGYLQRIVGHELTVRHCPELRFEIDRGVKGARRTFELLADNLRHDPGLSEMIEDDVDGGTNADTRSTEDDTETRHE